ncbi:MAG: type I DNA topoisomerase [Patescibacteria group bacterium]|nr:type I DNA topoisomerase [Patescibacteria group bacterium]
MSDKKQLVIVESPTKAKTISRFLGSGFDVTSSMGHIRDLPKSKLGVDVEKNFEPKYIIPPKAKETVALLKKKAKSAASVILATDEDREGEAISWHLVQALGLGDAKDIKNGEEDKRIKRIVFHEITKSAIEQALAHPRDIDLNLVDAQQARRILDRLVGYELSPFLWRKIRYGLSAGRVQSVAVRLVVEREREIQKFKAEEYWSIEAKLSKHDSDHTFVAKLHSIDDKTVGKMDIGNEAAAKKLVAEIDHGNFVVSDINQKEVTRTPAPPFTTSTLQQEASRKLGFSAKQTMLLAQQLYEGLELGSRGGMGLITYMRTDSVNLAQVALAQAREVITAHFGKSYALAAPRYYKNHSRGAQEAHEAIRPTDLSLLPKDAAQHLNRNQARLYELIWKRALACQMQPAILEQTAVDIKTQTENTAYIFRANGQVVKFDGFIRAYTEGRDEDAEEEIEGVLPELAKSEKLKLHEILPLQHFTIPPPRYTDATLVKALEAHGIGRPSTYAPTLATIQDREYVEKVEKKYQPTEIGFLVNDLLVEHFPEIVDINFTSHIEEELDDIAEGKTGWREVTHEFYDPFKKHLVEKEKSVEKQIEVSTTPCPHCGKMMIIRFGRMGKFLACPDPESKITQPMPEEAAKIKELEEKTKDERCPLCGRPMEVKRGRFGFFLGCTDYPKCKGISKIWNKTGFKCPACREKREGEQGRTPDSSRPSIDSGQSDKLIGDIVEKKSRGRRVPFYACTRYPDCTFAMNKKPEAEADVAAGLAAWKSNGQKQTKKPHKKKTA